MTPAPWAINDPSDPSGYRDSDSSDTGPSMALAKVATLDEQIARPILDVIDALVVVLDTEGRVLRFNRASETLTGYRFAEVEGRHVWDFLLPPEEAADVQAVFAELRAGTVSNSHSNVWLTRDGERRWIDWSNTVVLDSAGGVRLVIGTGIDMTGRIRIENELIARQAELSAVLESAVDAIITVDDHGLIRDANPATEAMFGYSASELIGSNVSLIMAEPERSDHDGYLRRYREGGERRIIGIGRDVTARHKDDRSFPVHLSVAELKLPGRRLFTGILHDLTERRRIEALSSRLGRIVEAAVNEVLVFDAENTRVQQANAAARRNLGYSEEEIRKLSIGDLCPELTPARLEEVLRPLRDGRQDQVVIETRQTRSNDESYEVRMQIALVRSESPPVFFSISEDITETRAQQEQLQQAVKMEAVGQLTGGLAHDFNNLLTVITGNLEMLGMRLGDRPEAGELIADAEEAADLGAQLTSRLLAFARRQPLAPKVIDANALVLDMSELLRRTLGERIRISTVLAHELRRTRVDPGQLQNALLNLAINSRDAMPEGGILTIETANLTLGERAASRRIRELEPGRYVTISVNDNGIGMPPEVARRAMEPFFSTKQAGGGTGLGLSMVYGFAKQSGGNLDIDSTAGAGTTVRMCLPAVDADEDRGEAPERLDSPQHGRGEHVLLVEDDPRVRGLAARRLEDLGYRVSEAEDGASALRVVESDEAIDLLFSDVVMPGDLDGWALVERARG